MREARQHRLMVPFIALLALVINVVIFPYFQHSTSAEHAAYASAAISFLVIVVLGLLFKPHLGE